MKNFNKYADVFCDPTFKYLFGESDNVEEFPYNDDKFVLDSDRDGFYLYERIDEVSITFVELGKYKEGVHKGLLEQWLYTLKNIESLDAIPGWITNGEIQNFYDRAEFANIPVEVRNEIDSFMTTELDWQNAVNYAEEKALKRGLAEGLAKGRAEGLLAVAKAMKVKGMPLEEIIELTELSKAQVEGL